MHSFRRTNEPQRRAQARRSIELGLKSRLLHALDGQGDRDLSEAARHHLGSGGRRLRRVATASTALALGSSPETAQRLGLAVERLHQAPVVHDELQDGDRSRRGREAVWARFGCERLSLVRNAWLACACGAAATASPSDAAVTTPVLVRCVTELVSGQLPELRTAARPDATVDEGERVARSKTGAPFQLCFELPLQLAGFDSGRLEAGRTAMTSFGVANQAVDDLSNLTDPKGRELGSDLRNGIRSLSRVVTGPGSGNRQETFDPCLRRIRFHLELGKIPLEDAPAPLADVHDRLRDELLRRATSLAFEGASARARSSRFTPTGTAG